MSRKKSERTSKADWLSKGLEMFARAGEQGLRVEAMAKELGVAKSGFYWHFRDRDDLLARIFDYWAHEYTAVISENPEIIGLPARERLARIQSMVDGYDLARHDAAFRAWAAKDPAVARKVRRVIRRRLDFVRSAFSELGFEGDDLEMRARLFVAYESNERSLFAGTKKDEIRRHRDLRLRLLLGSDTGPSRSG
jgi:AcrR family transcriptional regulator